MAYLLIVIASLIASGFMMLISGSTARWRPTAIAVLSVALWLLGFLAGQPPSVDPGRAHPTAEMLRQSVRPGKVFRNEDLFKTSVVETSLLLQAADELDRMEAERRCEGR